MASTPETWPPPPPPSTDDMRWEYYPNPAMPPGGGQSRTNTGLLIGLIVAIVALIVAVVFVFVVKPGSGASVPTGSPSSTSSNAEAPKTVSAPSITLNDPPVDGVMTPLVLPSLPSLPVNPIAVNTDGLTTDSFSPNLQKLADDIAAGNVAKIVSSCWTQPSDEVRQVYGSAAMRGAVLQALSQPPTVAQYGGFWTGQYVTVSAGWDELDSNYPCLNVSWANARLWSQQGLGAFTPSMAKWHMTRALAIVDGTPVHTGDGQNYQVICDSDCSIWSPHTTAYLENTAPIVNASQAQWQALRALSQAPIVVEHMSNGYFRVWAADGSTTAVAYFADETNDLWCAYVLGEIAL